MRLTRIEFAKVLMFSYSMKNSPPTAKKREERIGVMGTPAYECRRFIGS